MNSEEELKMTFSSVVSKDGKPMVSVLFERNSDFAEGKIPDGNIIKSKGFTKEEITALQEYMMVHRQEIIEHAKGISGIIHALK